jgi:hypothetical protein
MHLQCILRVIYLAMPCSFSVDIRHTNKKRGMVAQLKIRSHTEGKTPQFRFKTLQIV